MIKWAILYIAAINVISFIVMHIDKQKAKKNRWRIPEKTLFILALLGGSVGSIMGMYTFRHKTKHWYFVAGMPVILLLQMLLIIVTCFGYWRQ